MDAEDLESYIRTRTGMLMVNYSKKENPTLIDVFVKHLKGVPFVALRGGFDRAEIAFDRFPTVKKVMEQLGIDGRSRAAVIERSRERDRKSTRLNSSHVAISYAVFCLKKKKISMEK